MKVFISGFKDFIKADFSKSVYIFTLLFLSLSIFLNYTFHIEDAYIDNYHGKAAGLFVYTVFSSIPYFLVLIPKLFLAGEQNRLKNPQLWIKSILFLAIIGFASSFGAYKTWISDSLAAADKNFILRNLTQLKWILIYLPLLYLIWLFTDYKKGLKFYFYTYKKSSLNPYLLMLLFVLPLVVSASFTPDFIKAYPRFKPWVIQEAFGLQKWIMALIYETSYGTAYIATELIFRGALVIGMANLLGRHAVLPMVAVYTFYHFGKPAAEAASSIFGGYILGMIAYNLRNIKGGIILHLGLAYLMEIAALLQYYCNQR